MADHNQDNLVSELSCLWISGEIYQISQSEDQILGTYAKKTAYAGFRKCDCHEEILCFIEIN